MADRGERLSESEDEMPSVIVVFRYLYRDGSKNTFVEEYDDVATAELRIEESALQARTHRDKVQMLEMTIVYGEKFRRIAMEP